eukprot:TRINITY_DN112377_c0_g1_i1.p1 TRINITY_DN112377_c0_g1~~TRINITY_DN112377_c0_g1_i1.p1  ORF type:complete len:249 (+),score=39.90 TRINITY_DN112377_c0_g1_i1:72-818(+)
MGEKAALTRLRRECAIIQGEKIPHIVARPTEKSLLVWHYVLHDLPPESPYNGGVYWGKLVFPKEYPHKPPSIYMMTPSGRFQVNTRLCLSMSDFHPESWNPSWRIESILVGLVSFMLDMTEPRTTGGVHTTTAKRREYAKASFEFNQGSSEFKDLFPEFCDSSKVHSSGYFFFEDISAAALRAIQAEAGPTGGAQPKSNGAEAPGTAQLRPVDRNQRGVPATLLALSVVVVLLSCVGLLVKKFVGSGR